MSHEALEQAMYTRLSADVGASYVGIYSDVPQEDDSASDSAYPFLSLGPYTSIPFNTKDKTGENVIAQVHIWSRTHDNLARARLRDGIRAALDRYDLGVAGYTDCQFDGAEDFLDPDGKTRHIVCRFRVTYL